MTGRSRLLFAEAWRSLGANLSTTVAATMTVLIGMFLLGLFIALGTWTVSWSNHVKHELVVKVDFKNTYHGKTVTRHEETLYARALQKDPYLKAGGIVYVSKAQGLKIMQKQAPELVQGLPYNILPDRFELTPDRPEDVDKLYASVTGTNKSPLVSTVTDGKQISHRILQVAHVIEAVFVIATLVLVIASILLISNTIRLSIFSRRREIEVMKLVGATNWFVRGPFMLEGLICGIAGSLLAIFFLVLGKAIVLPALNVSSLSSDSDVHAMAFPLVALALIGGGLALGAVGSGLTIRRFLQV
ncbi:MAG TPA: permease-like cell division protein FtsX [Gaiellaceae bacterium]|jgi:cell division transport system permease protein|nr:permease-like cell division protein FtsX [Gaiellaceae bacterium]